MEKKWFVHLNGKQVGPLSVEEARAQLAKTSDSNQVLAWCEGMPTWRKVSELDELNPAGGLKKGASAAKKPAKSVLDSAHLSVQRPTENTNTSNLAPDELSAFLEIKPDRDERTDLLPLEKKAKPIVPPEAMAAERIAQQAKKMAVPYGVEKPKGTGLKLLGGGLLFIAAGLFFFYGGIYDKLQLMRFSRIDDVSSQDYDKLKSAASADVSQVSVALAISKADPVAPTVYVASNQPAGTVFEVQFKGIPGTLLNADNAALSLKVGQKNHLGVTAPLRQRTGEPLPVGQYQVEVSRLNTKGAREVVFQDKLFFLGAFTPEVYQTRVKEAQERIKKKMKEELDDLNTLVGAMTEMIEFNDKTFKDSDSIPIVKKRIAFWQRSKGAWAKRDGYFSDRFSEQRGPWTEESVNRRFFYPQVYLQTMSLWKTMQDLYETQTAFFTKLAAGKDRTTAAGTMPKKVESVLASRDELKKSLKAAFESLEKTGAVKQ